MKSNENKIKVLSVNYDHVIQSRYITSYSDYDYAIKNLVPLIDRLDIQRNIQDSKFYSRLEKDLVKGCIMPPITLAFIDEFITGFDDVAILEKYITENIREGFILDGIQRLNTLQRIFKKEGFFFDNNDRVLFINIVVCTSMDNLLYRMITLNNGQKPMSARHQIEILTSNLFEFDDSETPIITERDAKRKKIKVAFNKSDFVKGYLAFLANSTNIENQKIIEERLDELIADKILDSSITDDDYEFTEVIKLINKFINSEKNYKWFKNANNLIGFCVGIKCSNFYFNELTEKGFEQLIDKFETAFSSFNYSKIKVGRIRRILVDYYIRNQERLVNCDVMELVDILSQID